VGDPEDMVREAALRSLKRVTDQDALYDKTEYMPGEQAQKEWQGWWDKNKDSFEIADARRGMRLSAKELISQYDENKDGALNEAELEKALTSLSSKGRGIKKGETLKLAVPVQKVDGEEVELASLINGPTILYFFSSRCGHCRRAEDFVRKLSTACKDKKVEFLGVASSQEQVKDLPGYLAKAQLTFPVVVDFKKAFSSKNKVRGTPNVLIVDKNGKVQDAYRGLPEKSQEQLMKYVNGLP
jgi:peroxiredoxin